MVTDTIVTGTHMMVTWIVALMVHTTDMMGIMTDTAATAVIVTDCGGENRTQEVRL